MADERGSNLRPGVHAQAKAALAVVLPPLGGGCGSTYTRRKRDDMSAIDQTRHEPDALHSGCPECGLWDEDIVIGKGEWGYCLVHRTKWMNGSKLTSRWKHQTEDEQRAEYERIGLAGFHEVNLSPYGAGKNHQRGSLVDPGVIVSPPKEKTWLGGDV
jgi:hypothetical protein